MDTLTPAVVMTRHQLKQLLQETAKTAANETVALLKDDLRMTPREQTVLKLRQYIIEPETIENPRELWANSHHIRMIEVRDNGKPKSIAWFQKFKKASGLNDCLKRSSPEHGRLQEWCFEDIRLCWIAYYCFRRA